MESRLTTKEAAARLGISTARVRQMVLAGDLPAEKFGRDLMIREKDLALVADRKPGRPPKEGEKTKSAKSSKRSLKSAKKSRKAKAGTNHAGEIEEEESVGEEVTAKKSSASKPVPEITKSAKKKGGATK